MSDASAKSSAASEFITLSTNDCNSLRLLASGQSEFRNRLDAIEERSVQFNAQRSHGRNIKEIMVSDP